MFLENDSIWNGIAYQFQTASHTFIWMQREKSGEPLERIWKSSATAGTGGSSGTSSICLGRWTCLGAWGGGGGGGAGESLGSQSVASSSGSSFGSWTISGSGDGSWTSGDSSLTESCRIRRKGHVNAGLDYSHECIYYNTCTW